MSTVLKEAAGTIQKVGGHRYRSRLIEGDIWGSSGYYSKEVLERDGPTTWPAGTQIYLDHPTATDNYDRPERSVRDLAGKITSTPAYEADGLYAQVEFYPHYAPIIEAMWADVGMSIRASATVESGEAGGRTGPVIQSLENGMSVDVVTRAGAGGKLVNLLESARVTAPEQLNAVQETTSNDVDDYLRTAVRQSHANPDGPLDGRDFVWMCDRDDTYVYYEKQEKTWRQQYTLDGVNVTLTGTPAEVRRRVEYDTIANTEQPDPTNTPSSPAGAQENKEAATMATTQIEEAELTELRESAGRVTALEAELATERETRATEAKTARSNRADAIIAEAFGDDAPAFITESARILSVSEDFDADKLRTQATEAAAKIAEASGAGTPRGVGDTVTEAKTIKATDWADALEGK